MEFGLNPTAEVTRLKKGGAAMLFAAEGYGVSGWQIHLAVLRAGEGGKLENLLIPDVRLSNQSQHALSDSKIFVTANYVGASMKRTPNRIVYIVSACWRKSPSFPGDDGDHYYLADQYMTVREYDFDKRADVLASERAEILARLKRVRAEEARPPVQK